MPSSRITCTTLSTYYVRTTGIALGARRNQHLVVIIIRPYHRFTVLIVPTRRKDWSVFEVSHRPVGRHPPSLPQGGDGGGGAWRQDKDWSRRYLSIHHQAFPLKTYRKRLAKRTRTIYVYLSVHLGTLHIASTMLFRPAGSGAPLAWCGVPSSHWHWQ
ncbi:uncharacterized protein F5Z01DRAFT_641445 [Emericellopsis atlantica]|uniref:Uncharacterized protein n=1 Tax=Emericellopsis atlantica TaxID=2614577 RepID=A0A9P7ZWA7_9HYPO|nr:uncharacterized protein F5Z01DRAFT_641445 [Emericellopsis atlantica]KAG9258800.1 hypothetical protein F5Z01DRAFT_641445 [Emericellopsis atlantica]